MFLLKVLGAALLVAGFASALQVSAAVGAFLLGIAISGSTAENATKLLEPLRDLFAAVFFVLFGLNTDPATIPPVLGWAVVLAVATTATKVATGWWAARGRASARSAGRAPARRWSPAASSRSSSPGWRCRTRRVPSRARRAGDGVRADHGRARPDRGPGGGAGDAVGAEQGPGAGHRRRPPAREPAAHATERSGLGKADLANAAFARSRRAAHERAARAALYSSRFGTPAASRHRRAPRPSAAPPPPPAPAPRPPASPTGGATAGRRPGQHHGDLAAHRVVDGPGRQRRRASPRRTSSYFLVSSRHTAAARAGPSTSTRRGERVGQPVRRLEEDARPAARRPASPASAAARPSRRGAKPSKQNRSTGSPDSTSAVVTADGPGRQVTGSPSAAAAATSR